MKIQFRLATLSALMFSTISLHAEKASPGAAETASQELAIYLYPDLDKEGSPLYSAVVAKIKAEKAIQSEIFDNPQWPLLLAVTEAVRLNLFPKAIPKQNEQKSSSDLTREQLAWALNLENKDSLTPQENQKRNQIIKAHGGFSPENLARLTAIISGASISDVEAISQTTEMKKQTTELKYQSDRLQDLQENQENRVIFNSQK